RGEYLPVAIAAHARPHRIGRVVRPSDTRKRPDPGVEGRELQGVAPTQADADRADPLRVGLRAGPQERHGRTQVGQLALRIIVAAWVGAGLPRADVGAR